MSNVLTCPFCAQTNSLGSTRCSQCGVPIDLVQCAGCEAVNGHGAAHCHRCGQPLSAEGGSGTMAAPRPVSAPGPTPITARAHGYARARSATRWADLVGTLAGFAILAGLGVSAATVLLRGPDVLPGTADEMLGVSSPALESPPAAALTLVAAMTPASPAIDLVDDSPMPASNVATTPAAAMPAAGAAHGPARSAAKASKHAHGASATGQGRKAGGPGNAAKSSTKSASTGGAPTPRTSKGSTVQAASGSSAKSPGANAPVRTASLKAAQRPRKDF